MDRASGSKCLAATGLIQQTPNESTKKSVHLKLILFLLFSCCVNTFSSHEQLAEQAEVGLVGEEFVIYVSLRTEALPPNPDD